MTAPLMLPPRPAEELRLGRGKDNHVVLADPSVSRLHAVVKGAPGRWLVIDCGSRNGTWVGDVRLHPQVPQRLRDGDRLRLGTHVLLVRAPAAVERDEGDEDTTTGVADSELAQALSLSHYQLQVVRCLCSTWHEGKGEPASNTEIATMLGTPQAVDAVKAALRRAYSRAGLSDAPAGTKRRQLCRVAREQGWA